jgi:SpoVK/Ycf46/Vps4 family AAA+-type ATPase
MVQPSLRREGFSSVPDVTWDDVGGLDSLRKEFDRCVIRCIKNPEDYEVTAELKILSRRSLFYFSYFCFFVYYSINSCSTIKVKIT